MADVAVPPPATATATPAATPAATNLLETLLTCPICVKVATTGGLWLCRNGHFLCEDCHENLEDQECPMCRTDKIQVARMRPLEDQRETVPLSCNKHCGAVLTGTKAHTEHRSTCTKEPVSCMVCKDHFPSTALVAHIREDHKDEVKLFDMGCGTDFFTDVPSHFAKDEQFLLCFANGNDLFVTVMRETDDNEEEVYLFVRVQRCTRNGKPCPVVVEIEDATGNVSAHRNSDLVMDVVRSYKPRHESPMFTVHIGQWLKPANKRMRTSE